MIPIYYKEKLGPIRDDLVSALITHCNCSRCMY